MIIPMQDAFQLRDVFSTITWTCRSTVSRIQEHGWRKEWLNQSFKYLARSLRAEDRQQLNRPFQAGRRGRKAQQKVQEQEGRESQTGCKEAPLYHCMGGGL